MRLYLQRHGCAEVTSNDVEPALSSQGQAEITRMAEFMAQNECRVDKIYHSDKLRAQQTAKIMSTLLNDHPPTSLLVGLAPNDPVVPIAQMINNSKNNLLLVGHLPFMPQLLSLLTIGDIQALETIFTPGTIACLEQSENNKLWQLLWMIGPNKIKTH